jgi:hypothetical protein
LLASLNFCKSECTVWVIGEVTVVAFGLVPNPKVVIPASVVAPERTVVLLKCTLKVMDVIRPLPFVATVVTSKVAVAFRSIGDP